MAACGLVLMTGTAAAGLITLDVNPNGTTPYRTLGAAVATANADLNPINLYILRLAAGTYTNDYANVRRTMQIVGAGAGSTILKSTQALPNQKGIIHTTASLLVKGVTLTGAFISNNLGGNGAGIREQMTGAGILRVEDTVFDGNQTGILTAGSKHQANVVIIGSQFRNNGNASKNSGQEHALYVGDAASLTVLDSVFCGEVGAGHNIKSRAARTTISGVDSYEGVAGGGCTGAGNASRGIDLPNGGVALLNDVDLFQGPGSPNWSLMSYGVEGIKHPVNSLTMRDVDMVSTRGGVAIQYAGGAACTYDSASSFVGVPTPSVCSLTGTPLGDGPGTQTLASSMIAPQAVPEPGTLALLLAALVGFSVYNTPIGRRGSRSASGENA